MNSPHSFGLEISRRIRPGLGKKLALTYDNARMTDGAGAQLHRIYGLYSVSRLLGAVYRHSPLLRVDYQGLSALERNAADPDFHCALNDLFQIGSDAVPAGDWHDIRLYDLSLDIIDELVAMVDGGATGGRPILARLTLPHGIADRIPDCYEVCKEISPFASSPREGRAWRVAIHVRRGELFAVDSDRMLANRYYIAVAQNIARVLGPLGIDYRMELHTEIPSREFVVEPDHHGIANRIGGPKLVSPDMCRLDEFGVLPNLACYVNEAAIDCLRRLATADILVMSRSSFSYLAAILNRKGVILYHPFWHAAPSSWVTVGADGHFDPSDFRRAVAR